MEKPSIVEAIGQYLPLKPNGKEFSGHCPFHEDKHPSLSVNEEAGVFYCFGCGETGDVFDFLMKWSGKSFKEICDHLGIHGMERKIIPDEVRIAAAKIKSWSDEFSQRIAERMRDIGQDGRIAWVARKDGIGDKAEMTELLGKINHEWQILETLHDDLVNPEHILSLYEQRENLERLVSNG